MFERYYPSNWAISWEMLVHTAIGLAASVLAALVAHWLLFALLKRLARLSPNAIDDVVVASIRKPLRWAMIGFALSIGAQTEALPGSGWDVAARFLSPALLGWVAYAVVKGFAAGLEAQLDLSGDPIAHRGRRTRIAILARTATVAVVIITIALIMLNIPGVRDVGVTLMASAGLAALAVGAAAQPALKSLIAGLQMALTQPLRIGDLVKVDGQTGRVEEITMSFVTVRTWDERVLVVPTSRFLDESFENWSRVNERLTGPVMLHLDPEAHIEPIRAEFERFLTGHPLWDKRNLEVLLTDAYASSIELRLSMSAETIGDLFKLRCDVREHMLAWLRDHQPEALIRLPFDVDAAKVKDATSG